jgi:signal transduction histidine kinase
LALILALVSMVLNALGISRPALGEFSAMLPAAGVLVAFVIVAAALGALNLRHVSRPLDDLVEASRRIAEGDLSSRVKEGGPSELATMARAFNSMASRLQSQDAQRRAWLSDVTHELRTPLTILQGNLEGLADGMYQLDEPRLKSLLDEIQVLSRLTDDLRLLALAESGNMRLETESTDLTALIREIAAAAKAEADRGGVRLTLALEPGTAVLDLDPGRIRQVLHNVLFNALRYTPPGKEVTISTSEETEKNQRFVVVCVQDEGSGIAPEDLPHVFDRYYKASDSHGMGLGLAIAKHIVEAHGGHISVSSRPRGGTVSSFSLPA